MTQKVEETIGRWLDKKYATLDAPTVPPDEWKARLMDYFKGLKAPKIESSLQLSTAKWYCNDAVILPEDQDKCTAAVRTALHNKVDPLAFRRPMEIISRFGVFNEKEGLRPEDIPTFRLLREKDGLQVWSVENGDDDRECYEQNRRFCLSHFGEEDNLPWCLTKGIDYWHKYSSFPKEIATLNGHPVAFHANDMEKSCWWDRLDQPHTDIPLMKGIPGDRLHRVGTLLYDNDTLEPRKDGKWTDIHTGNRRNGVYSQWHSLEDEMPEVTMAYEKGHVRKLTVGSGVKKLTSKMIPAYEEIGSIVLNEGLEKISDSCFKYIRCNSPIKIPSTVREIGRNAFFHASLSVTGLPKRLESLGSKAFYASYDAERPMQTLTFPGSLKVIPDYAFAQEKSPNKLYNEVNFGKGVEVIGEGAFQNTNVIKLHLGSAVRTVGKEAFAHCLYLESVNCADSVESIGQMAFCGDDYLAWFRGGRGLKEIGEGAFSLCPNLRSVELEEALETLGENAFLDCNQLRSFYLPRGPLKEIPRGCFCGCTSLSSAVIPAGLVSIGEEAFRDCSSLTSLTLPDSVKEVHPTAFSGCLELKKITCSVDLVKTLREAYPNVKVVSSIASKMDKLMTYLRKGVESGKLISYGDMEEGQILVQRADGKYNFANINGRLLAQNGWLDEAKPFHNGVAHVQRGDYKMTIDTEGIIKAVSKKKGVAVDPGLKL